MGQNPNKLNKNVLASAIAASLAISGGAKAQEVVEEVLVTGIRASLEASMDTKRNAIGVVDAINAEDIGKFPDTNLAESLQRITGVSISRSNGEGSEITVRGFGPQNNMVTLNGRTMPGGSTYGGSSGADGTTRGGNTRAFDFSNLASEAVRGIEVYKTGKASIATGGIGATVNIKTTRPLDDPGLKLTFGAKALTDTTNRNGDDITPELSGLFSWTNEEDIFGVALSASYQERDSGYIGATVNNWNIGVWGEDDLYNREGNFDDPIFLNAPDIGQLYARPNDIRYAFSDTERVRTNAQLTLQFAPTDKLTGTLDYTFAKNEIQEMRGEITNWVQNGTVLDLVVFDDSAVATPIEIQESYDGGVRDIGFEQQFRAQKNTLDSIGLNLAFQATENLSFVLDIHDSSMESLPNGPGGTGSLDVGLGSPTKSGKTLFFGSELPYWTYNLDDCYHQEQNPGQEFVTNCNNRLDAGDVSSSVMRNWSASQVTEITQIKLDGSIEFDNGQFDFGIESRDLSSNTRAYNANQNQELGGWGADNPGEFPDGMIQPFNIAGEFDDFDTGQAPGIGFRADSRELANYLVNAAHYDGVDPYIGLNNNGRNTMNLNNLTEESTTGAYFQVGIQGSLGEFETNLLAGLRYETTNVDMGSQVQPTSQLRWNSDNDFTHISADETLDLSAEFSYDNFLPSLDFDIAFSDALKGRFSFSKTIARPSFGDLAISASDFGSTGATLNSAIPTATGSNPALVPLESSNFDVSIEWYFADTSYASFGLWEKRVINFIGTGQVDQTHFDIRDVTNGPRAEAAAAALQAIGSAVDDNSLHTMMVILNNPEDFPGGAADYTGTPEQISDLGEGCNAANPLASGSTCDLLANEDDPLTVFRTSIPENNKEAKIHGFEVAAQHFFGETGFGVLANYTFVAGDVEHNDEAPPTEQQFALLGLSDTANLVLMYEKYGIQARVAYNWRDEFLHRTNYQSSNNPTYTEAYSQIDLNVSYDLKDNLAIFFEGINVTGSDNREFARNQKQMYYLEDLGPRYAIGARYTF